jgi:hypothetical protein
MAVVISKTFTTAETMLNARTVRSWLTSQLGGWRGQLSVGVLQRIGGRRGACSTPHAHDTWFLFYNHTMEE